MKDLVLLPRKERVVLDEWRLTLGIYVLMLLSGVVCGKGGPPMTGKHQ
jgi:hypothetical protein